MYDDLVKSLRQCTEASCAGCKNEFVEIGCRGLLEHEAADAIEELVRKEKFHAFLWNTIQPNEMEVYLSMYNAGNEKEES